MALIRCPECGREVSDQAPACVGCGRPIAQGIPAPQGSTESPKCKRMITPVIINVGGGSCDLGMRERWTERLEKVVAVKHGADRVERLKRVCRGELKMIRKPLIELHQQPVVDTAAAIHPKRNGTVGALNTWSVGWSRAGRDHGRAHAVDERIIVIQIFFADLHIGGDFSRVIGRQNHAESKLALHSD